MLEDLEGRCLLSIDVLYARGIGAVGQSSDIRANAVATDAAGNLFVVGSLRGTANFATGATAVNVQSAGNLDLFVAKYAPSGSLVWATSTAGATANSVCQGMGLAIDGQGNVLLTGSFSGKVDFDPGPGTTTLSSGGIGDAFVAKLDGAGNLLWARDVVGTPGAFDAGSAVAVDAAGNAYFTGYFANTATFGTKTLTTGDNNDAFVAAISPAGQFLWAAATSGSVTTTASGTGIAPDGLGGVCVSGFFSGTVDLDPGSGVTSLTSAGSTDAFLWRLNAGGDLTWAARIGGQDFDRANAVALDADRIVYATGSFTGTVDFDPGPGSTTLMAGGDNDSFVLKLDASGKLAWARSFVGTAGPSVGRGLALDAAGNVITSGDFSGTVDFDPGDGVQRSTSSGSTDIYVSALDNAGRFLAFQSAGGAGFDAGIAVSATLGGLIAIAGRYTGPAAFGTTTLASPSPISIEVALLSLAGIPAAPAAPALDPGSDTGTLGDLLTANTRPTLVVSQADPTDLVELLRDGVVVASRTGNGTIADPGPVGDGLHTYRARRTNAANRVGPEGPALSLTIDATAPLAASALNLSAASDTGTPGDGITSARSPIVIGTAEAGSTVRLVDGAGNILATAQAGPDGSFSAQPTATLGEGTLRLSARAIDAAGNLGPAGPVLVLVLDATAPASPTSFALAAADDTGIAGDATTSNRRPRLVGNAEPGASVVVKNSAGVVVSSAVAGLDGSFSAQPGTALVDGAYTLSASATDAAGNTSVAGAIFVLTIDGTAPVAPTAPTILLADDTGVAGDGLTSVRRPRFKGFAEAGSTVQIRDANGIVIANATAASDGSFTAQPASALAEGRYALTARATDPSGNVGTAGPALTFVHDITPPSAPSAIALNLADDSATAGDGVTSVRRPRFLGTAEAGASVQILDPNGTVIASAAAGVDGSFSAQPVGPLPEGTYSLRAVATDAAGNVGAAGPSFVLTLDGTPPAAPSALVLAAGDDTGTAGDGLTSARRPSFSGVAEANAAIQLEDATGKVLASTRAGVDGRFSVQVASALPEGSVRVSARATDTAGNAGAAGAAFVLTIDATAPSAPSGLALIEADDTGVAGDAITSNRRPRLNGTAEAGATVRIFDGSGALVATATAGLDGTFVVQPAATLIDGIYTLAATAVDAAGNVGNPGPSFVLTIKRDAPSVPAAPVLLAADDTGIKGDGATSVRRPRLTGKVAPGLTIELLDGAGAVVSSTVAGADGNYTVQVPGALPVGKKSWSVRVRDASGNVSAAGAPLALKIVGVSGDFDGDGKADVSAYDPTTATWSVLLSGGGTRTLQFGAPGDIPLPADFDGDGKADFALYRPSNSTFYVAYSGGGSLIQAFGAANLDVPLAADFDGDGKADLATYRPSTSQWSILYSGGGANILVFGAADIDVPIPSDFDGDGKADSAVYRTTSSVWAIAYSGGGAQVLSFGAANLDRPIPADYDGDGKADLAVYRPNTSLWAIVYSAGGANVMTFGAANLDLPTPSDYDGDGKADLSIFRPPTADWAILQSGGGAQVPTFGRPVVGLPLNPPQAYRALLTGNPAALRANSAVARPAALVMAPTQATTSPATTVPAGVSKRKA